MCKQHSHTRAATYHLGGLTDLRRVRKDDILGLTVLLISFKQYDRGSRPNFGEGAPLEGEGVGGLLEGRIVDGES